ncbi:MAG TPA: pyridoxal-phosphate dependent enzyme [Gaiellaceae bacterium]|nr:pyridoxal-phosphate dependent enzyme [Gaiellaceae bacterium]
MSGSRLVCAGCGAEPARGEPYPFRCPHAGRADDVDHVLRRELDPAPVVPDDGDENPFVRWRTLLHASHAGLAEDDFVALVRRLDERIAEVDGHGFRVTPFFRSDALSDELGFSAQGGVWVKDETGNVSGSHKARHLFGVLVWLETADRLGLTGGERRDLAIASCGNAALAAAVVAAAGERRLRVFVPVDAEPPVLERLESLGAEITVCKRQPGVAGDPTVEGLMRALDAGALPFTCQGNLNGLAVEGGYTLGWELAAAGVALDRVLVQVGGGALASAVAAGLREGGATPRLDTVQTEGAWPLRRAYDTLLAQGGASALEHAMRHRHEFMWPWEEEPHSVAHGILDDETYDWAAVVEAMLATGGEPLVVGEQALIQANELGRRTTGIAADATGTAGLAGLVALRESGRLRADERVAVFFTGIDRNTPETKGARDAELFREGHPLAEGIRAN